MISSPRIKGYTPHSIHQNEEMSYGESKYFTPTEPRAEWMKTLYLTPPLPATPPPTPACWHPLTCQSQLPYSSAASPNTSYWQSDYFQRQNTPVMPSSSGYHADQYNQAQKMPTSPSSAGYYAEEFNTAASLNSSYQRYGSWNRRHNSMAQSPSAAHQHTSPRLQQQSALRSSSNSDYQNTLRSSYDHQYLDTQIPGITSSYWSGYPDRFQCQSPPPPVTTGYKYTHQYHLHCQSSPKIPVDSLAQRESKVNPQTTPVNSIQELDKIILDFEKGYSSPRKNDNVTPVGTGKFVKKMVAAFEQKYSTQTSNSFSEFKSRHNSSKGSKDASTQKSFSETVMSAKSEEKSTSFIDCHQQKQSNVCLNDTLILDDDDNLDMDVETEVETRFENDPDPDPESRSEPEPEPQPQHEVQVQDSIQTCIDTEVVLRKKKVSEPPARSDSFKQKSTAPKIVAAKLKKPIEFDNDTDIEWIPVRNQKLPRKSSFKKLLALLTGKKNIIKGSKFFCSLNKSNIETKLPQRDSGYVENSSSSSSLSSHDSSKVPASQPISEQPKCLSKENSNLLSFHRSSENHVQKLLELPSEDNSNNNNMIVDDELINKNKIVLDEIDRTEVRVSLGPSFPAQSKNIFTDIKRKLKENSMRASNPPNTLKKSKDLINSSLISLGALKTSFTSTKNSKSPSSSPKSKSPRDSLVEKKLNNSYKSFDEALIPELPSPTWEFPSSSNHNNSTYEYLHDWSQSEPHIHSATQNEIRRSMIPGYEDIIYDTPDSNAPRRPKSSIYEEALSVKRRTASFDSRSITETDHFYAQPDEEPTHFENINLQPKVSVTQQILRSMADNETNQLRAPYLVNSLNR